MSDGNNESKKNEERIRLLEEENLLLRVQLKLNIHEKQRLTMKYDKCKLDLHDSEVKRNDLQNKLNYANGKLNARPYLESIESDVVPFWLKNMNWLKPVDKWFLSLNYKVTPEAIILRNRLKELDLYKISKLLVAMYNGLFDKVSHDDKPKPLQLTDEQWKELLNEIQIYRGKEQNVIKKTFEPFRDDEYNQARVIDHYFLLVEKEGMKLEYKTLEDETRNIKQQCGTYAKFVSNFYFPCHKDKFMDQVYFQVDLANERKVEELIGMLENAMKTTNIRRFRVYSNK